MRTFVKMLLIPLIFTLGACSKQAPKQQKKQEIEVLIARLNIIVPQTISNDKEFDPQDYDNEE